MDVIRYDDVEAFYARVEPYLIAHEAEHNLTFGILAVIRSNPLRYENPFFAVVEAAGLIQLVVLMTPPRAPILSLAASPEALPAAIDALVTFFHESGIPLSGINGPVAESQRFAETWVSRVGGRMEVVTPLRSFKLEQVKPVSGVPGRLRPATPADRDLLIDWELAFRNEAFPEEIHDQADSERAIDARLVTPESGIDLWEVADGEVVSLTGYGGPTPHGTRIGPVYTPPEQRGHGYASALVAATSQHLLDSGYRFCFLFTDLRNPTSNHIYQTIGYQPVCDFTHYRFVGI